MVDVKKTAEKNAKPNAGPENQKKSVEKQKANVEKRVENVEQDNYLGNKICLLYKWLEEEEKE